jgi:RHS repeat-associated protein
MRRAIVALALFASLLTTLNLPAQSGSMRVSMPSPSAASLGKFGDVPVNLYTGVPDISIPLFTAKGRTLGLPIVLKYHAGGIRVEEIGGWAGIGWSLEAGGVITRTVRGLVDEIGNGYYRTGHTFWTSGNWPSPPTTILSNIATEQLDGDPDQFFFSFAGRSGQFVMGPTSSDPNLREYRTIPYQKLRILPTFAGSSIVAWEITAEDGTRYTFAAVETNTDYNQTLPATQIPVHYGDSYTSSWHLTEIRSPGGDVITLGYTPFTARHRIGSYREKFDAVVSDPPNCVPNQFDVINEYEIAGQRLTSITSAAHTITFTHTLRTDAKSPPPANAQQEPRLDKIVVSTPAGVVLRQFQFEHDYSLGGRLTLKNVYEQDRNGVLLPPYTFTYDPLSLPPLTSYAQDHWGFYNGQTSNNTSIPALNGYTGANRNPSAAFMKAGSLTRITYPTGGYNEFIYEANDYGAVGQNGDIPVGLGPPQSVTAFANAFEFTSTPFTVGGTDSATATVLVGMDPPCAPQVGCPWVEIRRASGQGVVMYIQPGTYIRKLAPGSYVANAHNEDLDGWASIRVDWQDKGLQKVNTAGGLRVAQLNTADGMGIVTVRKYKYRLQADADRSSGAVNLEPDYDYSFSEPGCSYYSRSSLSKMPLGSGGAVGYREVTVWHGANAEFGKTRHTFRSVLDAADVPPSPTSTWPFATWTSREWQRGQATGATEYNAAGQIQHQTSSSHIFWEDVPTQPVAVRRFRGLSVNPFTSGLLGGTIYYFNDFEVLAGWTYPTGETTTTYDEPGSSSFSSTRTYVYGNPVHAQMTEQTETNSNGTQRITRMRYPADYAPGSENAEAIALTAMQGAAHMHGPVIERWVTQKVGATETMVQAQVTSFRLDTAAHYLPYQTFVFNSSSGVTDFISSSVTSGAFTKDSRYLLQETADFYDSWGRIVDLTDPRVAVTKYQYGGNPNNAFLTQVKRVHDGSGSVDLVSDIAYNTDGFVSSIKDEGGTFRYFTYDLYGRLRQIKNNAQTVVKAYGYTYSRTSPSWTFNPSSPNAVIDTTFIQQTPTPISVVSTGYVDGLGRPIQAVVRDGTNYHVSATQYDLMGRSWRVWKPYTRTTPGYDASFVTNATTFYNTYHATSNAKPYTETSYTADALSRVKQVTPEFIGTTPTAFVVNAYGVDVTPKHSYTEVTDESGKKTRSYTDIFGNAMRSILGYGAAEATTTQFTYNVLGQRTQATDPRGLNTTYSFDTRGLLTARTSPDAGTGQSKYDKAGNVRYIQDANQAAAGTVGFATYDFANRALVSGVGAAAFASLNPDVTNTVETTEANWLVVRAYDAKPSTAPFPWSLFSPQITPLALANVAGRLAAVASKSGSAWQVSLFSYDADGQVTTRYRYTQNNAGSAVLTALNDTTTYTRDLRGALTQRVLKVGASAFHHWYDYNDRGLLWKTFASTSSAKPGTPDVTDTYLPSGQPQNYQFQGGPLVPIRYTIRGQTEKVGDPALTTYPFSARYAYLANGVVDTVEFYSSGSPAAQKRYRYAFGGARYDALNRLKGADFSSWSGSAWTTTLAYDLAGVTYDAAGNLTALQRYRETATLIDNLTYTNATTSNRLNSIADAVGVTAETWDAEAGSFTYDANGNIATAPAPYSITAVSYDPANLPLSITRSGVTSTYRYDDAGQRIAKQVGTGNTEVYLREGATTLGVFTVDAAGAPVSSSFNIVWENRVVGRHTSTGTRTYYHNDILGSTRAVTLSTTGQVVESYDFEPWGLLMPGRTLAGPTKEGFTGKEQDAETGLDYFGSRYYMAAVARWAAVDNSGDAMPSYSPYVYAFNSPLSVLDPDGDFPIHITVRAFAPYNVFGLIFRGDGRYRKFSTSLNARSKISPTTAIETAWWGLDSRSQGSWSRDILGGRGPGRYSWARDEASLVSVGQSAALQTHVWGRNSLVEFSPDIDVRTNLSISVSKADPNTGNQLLTITGTMSGDNFPASEAFVTDGNGTSVFLGVAPAQGGPLLGPFNLIGDKQATAAQVGVQIVVDKNGNFIGVTLGGYTMSIETWNATYQVAKTRVPDAKPKEECEGSEGRVCRH